MRALDPKERRHTRVNGVFVLCVLSYVSYATMSWMIAFVWPLQAPFLRRPPQRNLAELRATFSDEGVRSTPSFRRFFLDESGNAISPWHDLKLQTGVPGQYWMVAEIPKMTRAKFEVATKEPLNPLRQDIKNGELRNYHGPIFWNYGYFPQTWEDPNVSGSSDLPKGGIELMTLRGDNDPLDVVEIGSQAMESGEVVQVKVLGAFALIDEGELDWKILTIALGDPQAAAINSIADVEVRLPGVISGIREWFRWYKTPDDKAPNSFGFKGQILESGAALSIIEETHEAWKRLCAGDVVKDDLWTASL